MGKVKKRQLIELGLVLWLAWFLSYSYLFNNWIPETPGFERLPEVTFDNSVNTGLFKMNDEWGTVINGIQIDLTHSDRIDVTTIQFGEDFDMKVTCYEAEEEGGQECLIFLVEK
jgi:hypothetical protein